MKLQTKQSLAYFAAFVVLGLSAAALGPALPKLAENTGSTLSQISVLFSASGLGYLIGSLGSGWWFDRAPAHPLIAGVLLLLAGALALTPITPLLALLAVLFFLLGLAQSTIDVGGNALLVWIYRDQVGPRMNALHFFFGLGALISPLIVARVLVAAEDITAAYWLIAVIALAPAVLVARMPSPIAPDQSPEGGGKQASPVLVTLIASLFFLFVGAEMSYGGWVFTYATKAGLASVELAGYLTSLFWGSLTLGRLIGIPVAARLRPHVVLAIDIAGLIVSMAIVLRWAAVPAALWIGTIGTGFSMASVFPTLMILAEVHLPITGRVTSAFLVGASLGSMAVPWLIGQFFESQGPISTLFIIFLCILLAAAVFVTFQVAARRRSRRAKALTSSGITQ